jgi:hypothetical protein
MLKNKHLLSALCHLAPYVPVSIQPYREKNSKFILFFKFFSGTRFEISISKGLDRGLKKKF